MKKIISTLLTATLVVANVVPAFAAGVDGAGAVEYDNSVDITYDSFTVPTLAGSTYDFKLDPRDELWTYDKTTYARESSESNPGIYFHSEKVAAKIEPLEADDESDLDVDLYTLAKTEVDANAADWSAIVTGYTDNDPEKAPILATGDKYYVWTPADFTSDDSKNGTTATGKKGAFTELTASNIKTYFEISGPADNKYTIAVKENHLSEDCVFDGKLYKDAYTKITAAIQENKPNVNLADYVTLAADGQTITAVKEIYKEAEAGGYEKAAVNNIKFTPAKVVYQASTDKVIMTNKSTRAKTITAAITMSNISGLTFKDNDTFTNDATASVYFKATNGTAADDKTLAIAEGAENATATFTATVPGATVSPIKYQKGTNLKTGGHNYYNYEAQGTTYNSSSFWIEAKSNTEAGAAEAWKKYGQDLEAAYDAANEGNTGDPISVKPAINIVYTVANVPTAEEQAAADAAAADAAATEAANGFKTTYATILEKTTSTVAYADLEDVEAALAAYTELSSAAKAKLADEKALLDELKAAAEALKPAVAAYNEWNDGVNGWYVAKNSSDGFDSTDLTSATIDGVDVSSLITFDGDKWITLKYQGAAQTKYDAGKKTLLLTIGGEKYTTDLE